MSECHMASWNLQSRIFSVFPRLPVNTGKRYCHWDVVTHSDVTVVPWLMNLRSLKGVKHRFVHCVQCVRACVRAYIVPFPLKWEAGLFCSLTTVVFYFRLLVRRACVRSVRCVVIMGELRRQEMATRSCQIKWWSYIIYVQIDLRCGVTMHAVEWW